MNARRNLLALALLSSTLGMAAFGAQAATVNAPEMSAAVAGGGTPIDWAIDQAVASRQLSATDQRVLREQLQLQFQSLTAAQRSRVLAAAQNARSEESVGAVVRMLGDEVTSSARAAESALRTTNARSQQAITPKLGGDGDLVFVATVGPCRVFDSRNGPGQLGGGAARQVWTMSNVLGYDFSGTQGGTGIAGAGNCAGTVFGTPYPISVVAIVTALNTSSSGALQAWNGGTTLIAGGAVVVWNAGDRLTNTTVIPMDRTIPAYGGSGSKRDIGLYNNSGSPIDIVIDVVGYFIENSATALDCTTVSDTSFSLASGASVLRSAPACPAGYTPIMGQPVTNVYGVYTGTILQSSCRISNTTGAVVSGLSCDALCCRVPGR